MVSRRIDGRMREAERVELDQHLSGCPACLEFQRSLLSSWEALGAWDAPSVPDEAWPEIQARANQPRSWWTWLKLLWLPAPRRAVAFASFAAVIGVGMAGGALLSRGLPADQPRPPVEMLALAEAFNDLPAGAPSVNLGPAPRSRP
jgi:hypothetical protein